MNLEKVWLKVDCVSSACTNPVVRKHWQKPMAEHLMLSPATGVFKRSSPWPTYSKSFCIFIVSKKGKELSPLGNQTLKNEVDAALRAVPFCFLLVRSFRSTSNPYNFSRMNKIRKVRTQTRSIVSSSRQFFFHTRHKSKKMGA